MSMNHGEVPKSPISPISDDIVLDEKELEESLRTIDSDSNPLDSHSAPTVTLIPPPLLNLPSRK